MTSARSSKKNPPSLDLVEDPLYLKDAIKASQEATRAKEITLPSIRPIPYKTMPPVSEYYRNLGNHLGLCPYEIQEMMSGKFETSNTLVMEALKKLFTAIKITNEVDLQPVRRRLADIEERYQTDLKQHNDSKKFLEKSKIAKEKAIEEKIDRLIKIIYPVLQDIKSKLKINPKLDSLSMWERKLVHAFKRHKATTARVGKNPTIQIKPCLDLIRENPEAVEEILSHVRAECDREVNNIFEDWLHRSSDEVLHSNSMNHQDPDVREKCSRELHRRAEHRRKMIEFERRSDHYRYGVYDRDIWLKRSRWDDGWVSYSDDDM